MKLASPIQTLPPCLVAAAIALVLGAAPGHAGDHDKSAATTSNATRSIASCPISSCSGTASSTAITTMSQGACPMSACPAGKCVSRKSAATATLGVGAQRHVTRVTNVPTARPAAATARRASVRKPAARRAAGATASLSTPGTAGLVVVIDPATGRVVSATPEQLRDLAASSKSTGSASLAAQPADAEIVRLADGTLIAKVPERYMMNAIARRGPDGKITFDCENHSGSAVPTQTAPSTWEVK